MTESSEYVPEGPAHRLVVHVRFVLVFSPKLGHRFGVDQLEDAFFPVQPFDEPRTVVGVLQQFQQELPQVRRGTYMEKCFCCYRFV